jgi:hypothetical protein
MTTAAPVEPAESRSAREPADTGRGPAVLAALAVAWLAAILWAANSAVASSSDVSLALANAALSLPSVVLASLLAGAAVALFVVRRVRRYRTALGAAVGLAVGAIAGGLVLLGYGTAPALVVLAVAIGVAAVMGGALTAVRPTGALGAGLAGLVGWFGVGLVEGFFAGRLRQLFAASPSLAAQVQAAGRLSLAVALAGGVVAGLVAYAYLHRRDHGLRWPAYLLAGATPGLLLLVAEVIIRVGGGPLVRLAAKASDADQSVLLLVSAARLNTALVVLFTGAVVTVVAFGRTLRR